LAAVCDEFLSLEKLLTPLTSTSWGVVARNALQARRDNHCASEAMDDPYSLHFSFFFSSRLRQPLNAMLLLMLGCKVRTFPKLKKASDFMFEICRTFAGCFGAAAAPAEISRVCEQLFNYFVRCVKTLPFKDY
jgi:hypothetical protein